MKLDAPVSTIMTTKVITVNADQKLVDVKHIYEKNPFHHHIPVVEGAKLIGMISLIDFMRAIGSAGLNDNESVYQKKKVKDIMTDKPVSVKPTTAIKKIAKDLAKGEVHAFAVTEKGELKGIISYTDVIKYLLRVLD